MSVVGQALEDTPENILGFGSIQLDPNEEGAVDYAQVRTIRISVTSSSINAIL